jgi:hypothetical protein
MNLRKIERKDIEPLFNIHKRYYNFPFPDLSNPLYSHQLIVEDKDKIILAIITKLTSEGTFITDKEISSLTRTKAIKLAMDNLKLLWNFGLEDVHTFAENDDHYINILRKLGWQDCTGFPMVKLK